MQFSVDVCDNYDYGVDREESKDRVWLSRDGETVARLRLGIKLRGVDLTVHDLRTVLIAARLHTAVGSRLWEFVDAGMHPISFYATPITRVEENCDAGSTLAIDLLLQFLWRRPIVDGCFEEGDTLLLELSCREEGENAALLFVRNDKGKWIRDS